MEESNVLLEEMRKIFVECLQTVHKKNADYSPGYDPFRNFEFCEQLGICLTEEGILVRMADKFARVVNLMNKSPDVEDETVEDTLKDLINYAAILLSYIRLKQ